MDTIMKAAARKIQQAIKTQTGVVQHAIKLAEAANSTKDSFYTEDMILEMYRWIMSIGGKTVLCVGCGTGIHEFIIRTFFDKFAQEQGHPPIKFVFTEKGEVNSHYGGVSLACVLKMGASEAIERFGTSDVVVFQFRPTPGENTHTDAPLKAAEKKCKAFVFFGEVPDGSLVPPHFDEVVASLPRTPVYMLASISCKISYQPGCMTARSDLASADMKQLNSDAWGLSFVSSRFVSSIGPPGKIDRRFIGFELGVESTEKLPAPTKKDTRHYIETTVEGLSTVYGM